MNSCSQAPLSCTFARRRYIAVLQFGHPPISLELHEGIVGDHGITLSRLACADRQVRKPEEICSSLLSAGLESKHLH